MMKRMKTKTLIAVLVAVVLVAVVAVTVVTGGRDRAVDCGEVTMTIYQASDAVRDQVRHIKGVTGGGVGPHPDGHLFIVIRVLDQETKDKIPKCVGGWPITVVIVDDYDTIVSSLAKVETTTSSTMRGGEERPLVGGVSISDYVEGGGSAPGEPPPDLIQGEDYHLTLAGTGTLGIVTYDGKILSSCHVIARNRDMGFRPIGTPVVQPGGQSIQYRVGALENYVPILFGSSAVNYADAAIASIDPGIGTVPGMVLCETQGSYQVYGWTTVKIGDQVRKSGRTSAVTYGLVWSTNEWTNARFGTHFAYFEDQIVVLTSADNRFAVGGDSGSVVDIGGRFVGLVMAGRQCVPSLNECICPDHGLPECQNMARVTINKASRIINGLGIDLGPQHIPGGGGGGDGPPLLILIDDGLPL